MARVFGFAPWHLMLFKKPAVKRPAALVEDTVCTFRHRIKGIDSLQSRNETHVCETTNVHWDIGTALFYMSDEALYLQAAEEIKSGKLDPAIAAKAFAKGDGEENKTRAAYMELRVQQLKRELVRQKTTQIALTGKEGAKILVVTALRHIGYAIFVFLAIYTLIRALSRL
jgi:hypothetical protein